MVWIDGRLADEAEARVSPFDHGLLTGDGVFETLHVYRGVPFAASRHLDRLARSAAGMRLPLPAVDVLADAMHQVVAANAVVDGRLRITVTGGPGPLGSDRGDAGPTVIVASAPPASWPAVTDVVVVPWPRNDRGALSGLKTVSYGENVVALAHARDRGAGEALFANLSGNLCEGTGTNVFVGVGGRLLTPPLSSGCLAGITRELVLECTDAAEETLPYDVLFTADELFLTSTVREVQAVRKVDDHVVGDAPGPVTAAARAALVTSMRSSGPRKRR